VAEQRHAHRRCVALRLCNAQRLGVGESRVRPTDASPAGGGMRKRPASVCAAAFVGGCRGGRRSSSMHQHALSQSRIIIDIHPGAPRRVRCGSLDRRDASGCAPERISRRATVTCGPPPSPLPPPSPARTAVVACGGADAAQWSGPCSSAFPPHGSAPASSSRAVQRTHPVAAARARSEFAPARRVTDNAGE
jgi:hypothetical protein